MGVSMNPMSISKKKFHPQVCVGPYSVFELGWDLSDTSCPGNLASWLVAGPFAGCKGTGWFKVNLLLIAR